MAKPAKRNASPPPAVRTHVDPTKAALAHISGLIARGFDASRLQREATEVISTWSATLEPDELREHLDEVHDQLAEGVEAAEDMGNEIEPGDAASAKIHARSLGALMAARDAFGQAVQRL